MLWSFWWIMQPYVSFISLPLCLIFPITEILFAQPWTTVAPCPLVLAPGCPRSPCALLAPAGHFPQPEVSEGCPASRHLQALPVARGCQDLCCPLRRTEQNNTAHVQAAFFSLALGFISPPWLLLLWFAPSWASVLLKLHSSSVGPRLLLPWGKKRQKMALVAPLIYLFCFSEEIVPSSVWLCWF